MSTIVQLTQGTPAWLAYRLAKRNASESAAVMGLSPWATPYQLWLMKTGRLVQSANQPMLRGIELEPAARAAYEQRSGLVMQPLVLLDGDYSASLDGQTLDGNLILEIKCPMRGAESSLWLEVANGQVPEHYAIQVQHQLMVSGADMAHLYVFDGCNGILQQIDRDGATMERIKAAWEEFQPHLDGDHPPPLTDADTVIRTDAPWIDAAKVFSEAKRAAELQAERLDAARLALVALARHPKESGAGVSVTRFWKVGNVDYKKVPQLSGVNLDDYRGKAREEIRITAAS